jgi:type IV secretory pathway TraG/TraD family ATPase VirD4
MRNNDNKLLKKYRRATKAQKRKYILMAVLIAAALFLGVAWIVGSFIQTMNRMGDEELRSALYYGLTGGGLAATLILYVIVVFLGSIMSYRKSKLNEEMITDDRGVTYMKNGVAGTSHFADEDEVEENFTVCNIRNTSEMLFAQYNEHGEKVIAFKPKTKGATGTRHVIVFAPSGSGKSYAEVMANILQAIKRRESIVVVDPSGGLYNDLGAYCRNSDYDAKLLNLADLEYSEYWACLDETIDEATGRVSTVRLQEFTEIFMRNSTEIKGQDFWYESAVNIIEMSIGLLAYQRENYILEQYIKLYESITGVVGSKYAKKCRETFIAFPKAEEELKKVAVEHGYDADELDSVIQKIKDNAPEFDIEKLYSTINGINAILPSKENDKVKRDSIFDTIPKYHPASYAYARFLTNGKDTVRDSAIQGTQFKFRMFDSYKLRQVLSHKGINFKTINFRPSVYFVAVPDTTETMRPLASLFFSFFFKDVMANYDREEALRIAEGRENRCIPVLGMLDEFASLGVLCGSPSQFATVMNDARKRKLSLFLILQHFSLLESNYGKFFKDSILADCDVTLCLGSNDENTNKYISTKTGVATVLSESHVEIGSFFGERPSDDIKVKTVSRPLMLPDEVNKLRNEVLIMQKGCNPFIANTLPWTDHPAYQDGLCTPTSYFEMETLENRMDRLEDEQILDTESYVRNAINSFLEHKPINENPLTKGMIDPETGEVLEPETKTTEERTSKPPFDWRAIVNEKKEELEEEAHADALIHHIESQPSAEETKPVKAEKVVNERPQEPPKQVVPAPQPAVTKPKIPVQDQPRFIENSRKIKKGIQKNDMPRVLAPEENDTDSILDDDAFDD